MGQTRNTVVGREYFPWEMEFPSRKTAKKFYLHLVNMDIEAALEADLVYAKAPLEVLQAELERHKLNHQWIHV